MKMTREQAVERLEEMWENGEVPANFTQDHSGYEEAVECLMKHGYLRLYDYE